MPTKSNPRYDEILADLENRAADLLIPWEGDSASVRGGTNIAYFPDRRGTGSSVVLCDAAGIAAMLRSRKR